MSHLTGYLPEQVCKLAGMIYKSAYYTNHQWFDKTGVFPSKYPQYFKCTSYGKYHVTDKFRSEYKHHNNCVSSNWSALGLNN